jgi:hypothetical protein
MKQRGALQLRLIADARAEDKAPRHRLVGRIFFDGRSYVRVVGVSNCNPAQMIVARELDGKHWSVSLSLLQHILGFKGKALAAR